MVDLTQAIVYDEQRSFTIGGVFSKTARVFAMAPLPFLALGLLSVIPKIISEVLVLNRGTTSATVIGVTFLVQIIISALVQASVSYGAFYALRNMSFGLGEALAVGASRFVPVLLASLLAALVAGIGAIALVVPGLMALCALAVVVPACTIEKLGPIASLRRSAWLTKGLRWRIFGTYLILAILSAAALFLAAFVAKLIGGLYVGIVASNLAQILTGSLAEILIAVLYYDLRASREGFLVETIADIFD